MATDDFFLRKHVTKLSADDMARVRELSQLDPSGLGEAAIREQILAPLIRILGYRAAGDYQVLYENNFKAGDWYVMYGREKIKLDYRFVIWKQGLWLLEAKPGPPRTKPDQGVKPEDAQQAYSYSSHPKIDAPLFAVSNGAVLDVYDRDNEGLEPILTIRLKDLPNQINKLRELLAADQVQFYLKRKLLKRIKQVLSSELVLSRPDEFATAVRRVAHEVRSQVHENFHANVKAGPSFVEIWDQLASGSRPDEIIDNFFLRQMSGGLVRKLSERIGDSLASTGNYLFFARLLLEELRPVTIHYHHNVLFLLGTLAKRGAVSDYVPAELRSNGRSKIDAQSLFIWWLEHLVTGFQRRADLRTLWLVEGLAGRIAKRLLILPQGQRSSILQHTSFARYHISEAELDRSGSQPANVVIGLIERAVISILSDFVATFYDPEQRQFKRELARQEYDGLLGLEARLNRAPVDYPALLKELGPDWSELIGYDSINRTYDLLGSGALNIARLFPELCTALPESISNVAAELASLHHAPPEEFCKEFGIDIPTRAPDEIQAALDRRFAFA